jgi:hypothetical protein
VTATTSGTNNVAIGTVLYVKSNRHLQCGYYRPMYLMTANTGSQVAIGYFAAYIAIFNGTISPVQATTAAAPAYVKGAMYFDTTLNKLRIGGATAWETVTSV